ncbi:DUF4279 domain-containing protein [Bacillus toyonensis]|uniref:DUF4279 domain-containing protein n=1 Tax=Bacillus toyonensis TaxID=155322 RepID=A0A2B6TDE5_9BACI|nr:MULTISPECIES: DUF4279 domain-containing protein [Bacillus]AFU13464.1 hypothetical protein MC28_2042 [Bacillus thuringiensis MC28]OTW75994.1 hypothetical protein BK702_30680 [Bacillus thuringiensis serovar cameroun]OTX00379.1 hypothetical protein BK712_31740 [Bacillus thuringiensis serovar seoulensis]OTX35501.1 hypothetical protein BK717_14270 [Bacillus thuringiensis serovar malayensis]OUB08273.1 hypothetical protein BK709_10145 [Bacillus thuringiensis serovar shandongiensis]PKR93059.1 hypo
MDETQVMVYFNLSGDEFPVEVVSERLQVSPTKSYKKGDIIRKTNETENITRNYTSWQLSTGYQESLDVGDVMEQLILKLKDKSAIINELKREFGLECRFTIVIKINDSHTPAFHLDNPVIDFANSIKADFDIDLYANPYVEEIK